MDVEEDIDVNVAVLLPVDEELDEVAVLLPVDEELDED